MIAACLEYCGMEKLESQCKKIPTALHIADSTIKKVYFVIWLEKNWILFLLNAQTINVDRIEDPASDMDVASITRDDAVNNFATNFTKMGLLRKVVLNAPAMVMGIEYCDTGSIPCCSTTRATKLSTA